MRTTIQRILLAILNSEFINRTPARFGFINGLDAISYEELVNEDRIQPGITVRQVLQAIDRFRSCPLNEGLTIIEGDTIRPADMWDVHELRNMRRGRGQE